MWLVGPAVAVAGWGRGWRELEASVYQKTDDGWQPVGATADGSYDE